MRPVLCERCGCVTDALGLSGVAAIGDRAVANRDHANCLLGLGELVDDPVSANAERSKSSQPPTQRVSGEGIAFEEPERVLYGVDERPVECE
jgi:hypothetical protein